MLVRPSVAEGELRLSVSPGFPMNMVNRPDVINLIRMTASKVLGRPLTVRVEEMKAKTSPQLDKLGELEKFGNVFYR